MGNLLPPYESLSADIDGDHQNAAAIYYSYLMSPEKIRVIANILAAMKMGKSILLFVPEDESMNFGFVTVLNTFFANFFGICIGMGTTPYAMSMEPVFVARRADAMFINDLMTFQEYCVMMPPNIPASENACGKIMQSINYRFNSMPECVNYCNQYIDAMRQQSTGTFTPVFRVNK